MTKSYKTISVHVNAWRYFPRRLMTHSKFWPRLRWREVLACRVPKRWRNRGWRIIWLSDVTDTALHARTVTHSKMTCMWKQVRTFHSLTEDRKTCTVTTLRTIVQAIPHMIKKNHLHFLWYCMCKVSFSFFIISIALMTFKMMRSHVKFVFY